jgi:quercetin dioxygenase-like cupin family protein
MKRYVIGKDEQGRSTVVKDDTSPLRTWGWSAGVEGAPHNQTRTLGVERTVPAPAGGGWTAELWASVQNDGVVDQLDPFEAFAGMEAGINSLEVPAGTARFSVTTYGPGYRSRLHSTDSIDFDICIAGELTLGLENGEVHLTPGDVAIVPGSMHYWTTEHGGAMAYVMLSPHAVK